MPLRQSPSSALELNLIMNEVNPICTHQQQWRGFNLLALKAHVRTAAQDANTPLLDVLLDEAEAHRVLSEVLQMAVIGAAEAGHQQLIIDLINRNRIDSFNCGSIYMVTTKDLVELALASTKAHGHENIAEYLSANQAFLLNQKLPECRSLLMELAATFFRFGVCCSYFGAVCSLCVSPAGPCVNIGIGAATGGAMACGHTLHAYKRIGGFFRGQDTEPNGGRPYVQLNEGGNDAQHDELVREAPPSSVMG